MIITHTHAHSSKLTLTHTHSFLHIKSSTNTYLHSESGFQKLIRKKASDVCQVAYSDLQGSSINKNEGLPINLGMLQKHSMNTFSNANRSKMQFSWRLDLKFETAQEH